MHTTELYATAWGRNYTMQELLSLTPNRIRLITYKVRTYNVYLRIRLAYLRAHIYVLRSLNEFVQGLNILLGK